MTIAPEEIVRITSGQGIPWDDMMRMQTGNQDAVDAFIEIALGGRAGYSGFQLVRTSDTVATISPGRLFGADGKRYALVDNQAEDLFSALPVSNGVKVISFVASGTEVDTEAATRVFKVDADLTTPGTPQSTATRRRRVAVVQRIAGTLGPEPVAPVIPAGYIEIGRVVLSQAGIVGDPEMVAETRVPTLAEHADKIAASSETLETYAELLSTLRSDMAALADQARGLASRTEVAELTRAVGDLRSRVETPAAAVHIDEDTYETDDKSDDAAAGYAARIDGGLRFPRTSDSDPLALFQPNDPLVKVHPSGLVLPAYTEVVNAGKAGWYGAATSPIRPRDYTVSDRAWTGLGAARSYWWYGPGVSRADAMKIIQETGIVRLYDPKTGANINVNLQGKSWTILSGQRSPFYHIIYIDEPYSDIETTAAIVSGAGIAQTWLNPGLQWVTGVAVGLKVLDPTAPINVLLCHLTAAGTPDLTRVITSGQLAGPSAVLAPAHTVIPVAPALLLPGQRIAAVLVTTGLYQLACYPAQTNHGGTLFYAADGVYWMADPARDLAMSLRVAQFSRSVTTVEINAATLAGGMRELELAVVGIEYGAGTFGLLGRGAGDAGWRSISEDDGTILSGAPDVLQLQARWVGTQSMQAGIWLGQSRLLAARAQSAMLHVSEVITLPSARTAFSVQLDLVGFDDTPHDVAVSLLSGALYATETAASATVIEETADVAVKRLTATFTLGAAAGTVKVKTTGSTSDVTSTFAVRRRRLTAN